MEISEKKLILRWDTGLKLDKTNLIAILKVCVVLIYRVVQKFADKLQPHMGEG